MYLKKLPLLIFLVLFFNQIYAQGDLPESIISDSGSVQQLAQQQASQIEILSQLVQLNEKVSLNASQEDLLAMASELNKLNEERKSWIIIISVLINMATIAGFYGIYFYLKSRKRI